jgi:hypothetical protein
VKVKEVAAALETERAQQRIEETEAHGAAA